MTDFADLSQYYRGSTYKCTVTVTDPDTGDLVDPTSITCGFIGPDGTAVTAAAMTNDGVGLYHFDYRIPADALQGVWASVVTATSAALVKISEGKFLVM